MGWAPAQVISDWQLFSCCTQLACPSGSHCLPPPSRSALWRKALSEAFATRRLLAFSATAYREQVCRRTRGPAERVRKRSRAQRENRCMRALLAAAASPMGTDAAAFPHRGGSSMRWNDM